MDRKKQQVHCASLRFHGQSESSAVAPHSSQKPGLTPISCHAVLERSACAPFIKERRMECINATSLHRKSGPWGTQHLLLPSRTGNECCTRPAFVITTQALDRLPGCFRFSAMRIPASNSEGYGLRDNKAEDGGRAS